MSASRKDAESGIRAASRQGILRVQVFALLRSLAAPAQAQRHDEISIDSIALRLRHAARRLQVL